jgi:hypothetical protein
LISIVLVTGAALAATGLAPSAMGRPGHHHHRHPGKPDLVIAEARKVGPPYAFKGHDVTLSFRVKTRNVEKKGHDAYSGSSFTRLFLLPSHSRNPAPLTLNSLEIGLTPPGGSTTLGVHQDISTDILALGSYKVKVCADWKNQVKERNEANNCMRVGNFYVVKQTWQGSVKGIAAFSNAAKSEKWSSSKARLDFGKYLGGGRFRYDFTGTVGWNDSGVTTGGCSFTGDGVRDFDHLSGPVLDYFDGSYQGKAVTTTFFTVFLTPVPNSPYCTNSSTVPGPTTREIFNIKEPQDLLFDQNELKGSTPGDTPGAIWKWDFN